MVLFTCQFVFSQSITTINYFKWSDPTTFKLSPSPYIKGYGHYSDSLSNIFDDKDFYEFNNEYYCIESWADYYYWYTKKYWHQFDNPAVYEYYYWTKNDLGMASYIASYNYHGKYYPSSIKLIFKDVAITNRLSSNIYIAKNENQITQLKDQKQHYKTANKQASQQKWPSGHSQRGINTNRGSSNRVQPATTSTSVVTSGTRTQSKNIK